MHERTSAEGLPASSRILVVDDNVDAAETLAEYLRLIGFDALTAHDGRAALESVAQLEPDTVVIDIGLPLLDGYQVARTLRERGFAGRLIALTGYGTLADRQRALASGFDRHLVKPVDVDLLESILRSNDGRAISGSAAPPSPSHPGSRAT